MYNNYCGQIKCTCVSLNRLDRLDMITGIVFRDIKHQKWAFWHSGHSFSAPVDSMLAGPQSQTRDRKIVGLPESGDLKTVLV